MTQLALITGAARGLGAAIATRLARDGKEVLLTDIDTAGITALARQLCADGLSATAHPLDVTNELAISALFARIDARHGRLDILVNNAADVGLQDGQRVPLAQMRLDTWERTLRVNATGPMLMCRAAIPLLRKGEGKRIVNIASRAARTQPGGAHIGNYAASKATLIGLSRVLAGELGPDGITVNCIAPSTIATALTLAASKGDPDYFTRRAAETVVGRIGTPKDVAAAVAYFCAPEASFVTGTVLDATGGSFMP